jgi:hypothetical protein
MVKETAVLTITPYESFYQIDGDDSFGNERYRGYGSKNEGRMECRERQSAILCASFGLFLIILLFE